MVKFINSYKAYRYSYRCCSIYEELKILLILIKGRNYLCDSSINRIINLKVKLSETIFKISVLASKSIENTELKMKLLYWVDKVKELEDIMARSLKETY